MHLNPVVNVKCVTSFFFLEGIMHRQMCVGICVFNIEQLIHTEGFQILSDLVT